MLITLILGITACSETDITTTADIGDKEENNEDHPYLVFDMYLRNISAKTEGIDALELNSGSSVFVNAYSLDDGEQEGKGVAGTGLEYSARVGMIIYGNTVSVTAQDDAVLGTVGEQVRGITATGYTRTSGKPGFDLGAYTNYNGTADIDSSIASKWLKEYTLAGYTATNTEINGKATAYLLDTNAWSGFKDGSGYAKYAVGAATMELFVASYNKYSLNDTIEIEITEIGYNGCSLSEYDRDLGLYLISDYFNDTVYSTWIASPGGNRNYEVLASSDSKDIIRNSYDDSTAGARPVICLNSSVRLEKQADGSYKIAQ